MKLGLHTYSLHLHGMGQNWGGYELQWPRVLDIWSLMDQCETLTLDGLHITAVDCETTEAHQLKKIRAAAEERGLFLEYNFSLDEEFDPRLNNSFEQAVAIANGLGADVAKCSLDIRRPRPLAASRMHKDVMGQLEKIAEDLTKALPRLEDAKVRVALENHTETFAEEILWLVDQVNHPLVGACVDTVNSVMVLEDPMTAIELLAPRSFTNHFCDHRIERDQFGCRFTGVACGDGDIDLKRACDLIRANPAMERINIEVEWDAGDDPPDAARKKEWEAMVESIRYCREELGI